MTHVPFKGGAHAVNAVASGDVLLTFGTPPSIIPLAKAGRIKMLAVTSAQRSQSFPTLPTLAEAGLTDFDYTFWFGLFGPAGLPKDVASKLADASAKAIERVAAAIRQEGGIDAVNLRVAEKYVEAIAGMARTNNTMIVPANLGDLAGLVATAMKVVRQTGDGAPGAGR